MIIDFGTHYGKHISDPTIPDDYMKWLATRGKYASKKNKFEIAFKVPLDIWAAARGELEKRGYYQIGERWELK